MKNAYSHLEMTYHEEKWDRRQVLVERDIYLNQLD